jgi:hypothetical protein
MLVKKAGCIFFLKSGPFFLWKNRKKKFGEKMKKIEKRREKSKTKKTSKNKRIENLLK